MVKHNAGPSGRIQLRRTKLEVREMRDWVACSERLPDEGIVVDTKIDDAKGLRNVQQLKRRGRLWFLPDDSMYVYYTPTHWIG